ncbi:MAG TPA: hypothetical protein VGP63_16865 [Planctomycetaceae bacterium]|nr:hypothetical protein [Planctomycetaceae bacterium]
MRRSHSVSETSVGLFAFLDVLMSTMGSLILVLMIVSPKIRQEKMAKAATEAARDIVKVEPAPAPAPAPVPLPVPVVAPPRETIDLNAKFAKRVAELSGQADDQRRAAAEKQQSLTAQRESSERIRAQREQLERELAELRATKDHTLVSAQDLAAEGLKVESELAKRGSRLRKIRDHIAHESTEYEFVAYDGVSGTTRRPILIECADDQIKFPEENITLTASDMIGSSAAANPVLAGAEALAEYWTMHSKPDDPKPYVLLVVRPSGTLAYYRARNLLQRMKSPFGYELLSEDQKLAAPAADKEALAACRRAIDQAIAKRESAFDQAFANGRGLSTRNPGRRGASGSRFDGQDGSRIGNSEKPGAPFDDPFDLTSGGSKGTGKGPGGDSLAATGNSVTGNSVTGGAAFGAASTGSVGTGSGGPGGVGPAGASLPGTNPTGTSSAGAGSSGVGSDHVGGTGFGSGNIGPGGIGSNTMGPGGGGPDGLASGNLAGMASKGTGDANGVTGSDDPNNSSANGANGTAKTGSQQWGSNQKGNEGGKPVASLAGSAGAESVVVGSPNRDVNPESGSGRADAAFELSPAPGAPRTGGGDGKVSATTAAGDLNFESTARLAGAADSQAGHASLNMGPSDTRAAGFGSPGFGSAPTTPILQAGTGPSPSGSAGTGFSGSGFSGGGAGQSDPSSTGSGQPDSSPQISSGTAGGGGTPDGSGLPGGSPSGGSPGADAGGESGQGGGGSADPSSGGGIPSFGPSSDGSSNGNFTRRRWGYSSSQATIGFEHDVTIWIGARAIVVGGQPPVPISRADSVQRLTALVVPAIDREARAWGRPPDHLYWVPNVKFVVSPGGNLPFERLRPVIERHGLVSSVDYCLEPDSPRQTFQSWVQ